MADSELLGMVNVRGDLQRMKVIQGKDLTFTKRDNTYLYCFYCTEYTLKLLLHYLTYHKNYVAQVKFQKNQKISGRVLTLAIFPCFKTLYLAKPAPLVQLSPISYLKPLRLAYSGNNIPQTGTTSALQPPHTFKTTMPTTSHAHARKHMRTRTCMHTHTLDNTQTCETPVKSTFSSPHETKRLTR